MRTIFEPSPLVTVDRQSTLFDQSKESILLLLRNWAVRYNARGYHSMWVLMNSYRVVKDVSLPLLERDIPIGESVVFKVVPAYGHQGRVTFEYEFFEQHGGLYFLNLHTFLELNTGNPVGAGCRTLDLSYVEKCPYVPALVMISQEEAESDVMQIIDTDRYRNLAAADLYPTNHYNTSNAKTISAHHEYLFDLYRSDLLVFDADFLPDNEPKLIRKELSWHPDGTNRAFTHVWHCRNPVNKLVYGHGGPKLFPRLAQKIRRASDLKTDFTLSVGNGVVVHPVCLGTHNFNWSAFSSWRTAAKECAKLKLAASSGNTEAESRLSIWLDETAADKEQPFAIECLRGAHYGAGHTHAVLGYTPREMHKAFLANN